MKELQRRVDFKGGWDEIRQYLDSLYETEIRLDSKRYLLRSELQGVCGKIFNSVGVAILPSVAYM